MEFLKRQFSPDLPDKHGGPENKDKNPASNKIEEKYRVLISTLRSGDIRNALEIVAQLNIPESDLKSSEMIDAVCQGILLNIENQKTEKRSEISSWYAEEALKNFWLPKEKKEQIGYHIILALLEKEDGYNLNKGRRSYEKGTLEELDSVRKKFSVSNQKFEEAVFTEIMRSLDKGETTKIERFKKAFSVDDKKFKTPETVAKLHAKILEVLKGKYLFEIDTIVNEFSFPQEELSSPEITEAAFARFLRAFKEGDLYNADRIQRIFSEVKKKSDTPEVSEAAYFGLLHKLNNPKDSSGNYDLVRYLEGLKEHDSIIPKEKLQTPEVVNLAIKEYTKNLGSRSFDNAELIKSTFSLPAETLNTPEILDAAYKAIRDDLGGHYCDTAVKIKKEFPQIKDELESQEIMEAVARAIPYWIDSTWNENFEKYIAEYAAPMQKNFPLPQETLVPIVQKSFRKKLRGGEFDAAIIINKYFPLPEEELRSEEIVEFVSEKISEYFTSGNFDSALELATNFKLPQDKINSLMTDVLAQLVAQGRFFDEPAEARNYNYDNDEDDEYHYIDRESAHSTLSIESLVARFPHLKDFLNSKELQDKIQEHFLSAATSSNIASLENIKSKFDISAETIKKAFEDVLAGSKDFATLRYLNDLLDKPIDPLLSKTSVIFGEFANVQNYETIKSIYDGKISDELKMFGVKQGGEAGVLQLEQGFARFRQEMYKPDFDPHILQKSKLAQGYFKSQIRFSESEWQGDGHDFQQMLDRYVELYDDGEYEMFPLNENYSPSEVVYIDTVDKNSKPKQYSESFLNRFKVVSSDIKKAKELYQSKFPISEAIKNLEGKTKAVADGLQEKLEKIPNEKGRAALGEKIEKLRNLNLRNLNDFQENFAFLSDTKEFEQDLRQLMFLMGFAKNRSQLEKDLRTINVAQPSLDDLTWTMNFVDHIVNKEVMSQYFTEKQARTKFRDLVNTKSFEEELSRFQNQDKTGTMPMKFIPTRGILMEFSGHIADACWADKYDYTIPASFPNFTSVIMVQNPGTKHERLCGSCMLIDTREGKKDGEPILLIRGLNPIENTINKLSTEDFFNKFTEYVRGLAEKTGRKVAIVMDGHSGGATTNRPMLFNYLSSLKLKNVRVPYRETEFNGYDVTRKSYLL